ELGLPKRLPWAHAYLLPVNVLTGVNLLFDGGGSVAGAAGSRFGVRAVSRWAVNKTVEATSSMAHLVGVRVARRVVLRGIPVLNIPLGVVLSDVATNRLGRRAREFYRAHPRPA
ncbi:hypothetical protein, partial [Nocardioides sp. NPDC000441]|uniref:hypothetical protein n=1 Tax=Nocardioides sp. NPDC000441 TaxID=3154256 RepID=UPI003323AF84